MTSSVSYGLITWANKYASGTMVIGYTVTQPVASAIAIQTLVSLGLYEGCKAAGRSLLGEAAEEIAEEVVKPCLDLPDKFTAIGAIGVFCGLMAIIHTETAAEKETDSDLAHPDSYEEEGESLLELAERHGFSEDSDYEF